MTRSRGRTKGSGRMLPVDRVVETSSCTVSVAIISMTDEKILAMDQLNLNF